MGNSAQTVQNNANDRHGTSNDEVTIPYNEASDCWVQHLLDNTTVSMIARLSIGNTFFLYFLLPNQIHGWNFYTSLCTVHAHET